MENPRTFWDNRYTEATYTYGTLPNQFFKQQLDLIPTPGRLLLLAEGEGRNAVYAAQKGWQVTAVDFSEKGRAKALALAADNGVHIDYQLANVQSYEIQQNGPWDAIGLIFAHFHSDIRSTIHKKCAKALRPGGRVILEAFNRKQIGRLSGGPKDMDMLYAKILLEDDFTDLEPLMAFELTMYLNEGNGHVGLAELVRYVAEKRLP